MKLLIADGCVDSVNVLSSFLELSGYKIDDACLLETTTGLIWLLTLSMGIQPGDAPYNSLQYTLSTMETRPSVSLLPDGVQ